MRRIVLTAAAIIAVGAVAIGSWLWSRLADSRVFTTQKVCQLTGEWDKQFNQPTPNFNRHFGITGTDLGFPVPWNDKLYFLFGDTRSTDPDAFDKNGEGYDSLAVGPLHVDVDREGCVALEFATEGPDVFRPVQFADKGQAPRKLGKFEVPVSGFGTSSTLFGFFALRDLAPGCPRPDGCALGDPQPGGQTKLGLSSNQGRSFTEVALVSKAKFQWPIPVLAEAEDVPGLPSYMAGTVVLIWGTGKEDSRFRFGYPFFAVAPLSFVGFMDSWRYFTGLGGDGKPVWSEHESASVPLPPFGEARYDRDPRFGPGYHKCVGEFSAGYVSQWHKWMMLYACGGGPDYNPNQIRGIYLRTADTPWGPWSEPQRIFDPAQGYCRFMHSKDPCAAGLPNPGDDGWQETDAAGNPKGEQMWGGEYAPFLIPSYTKVDGDTTSLYWVMSTWNPYQAVLMRTRARPLRIGDFLTQFEIARR
jgi:hypothetical protein